MNNNTTTSSNDGITWAPIVPLIGGFPLGAELAIGKPPVEIFSYDGFSGNDSQYVNFQHNTRGREDIPYTEITEENADTLKRKINIIVGTPPCAALSQLNTSKSADAKGATSPKNDWMYKVAEDGMKIFEADVIMIENAPALYTKKGTLVAERMYEMAKENNYSLSLYKTSTMYHGVPQARDRTFACFWRSPTAPILEWHDKEFKEFKEYLSDIPDNALQQELVINENVGNKEPYYRFITHLLGEGADTRKALHDENFKTSYNYVNRKGLLQDAIKWFEETGDEKGLRQARHAEYKQSIDKGIWDGSTHVFNEYMNAVIGRNLNDTIHPTEDRSLTVREALHMMAFPDDFELIGGLRNVNMIAQNVPVCTAADMVRQAVKFVKGELAFSESDLVKQNNHKNTVDVGILPNDSVDITTYFVN